MAEQALELDTGGGRMNQKDSSPSHGQAVPGVEADAGGGHGPEPTALLLDAPAWIAAAMLVVIAIMIWKKVPAAVGRALDGKIAIIRQQLDQAAKLRAEAEALRDEYRAKAAAADADRQTMIERARHEAEAIVEQAKVDSAALIERRSRMAEDKIAAAERHAVEEVRARAATAAAAAAARLISEEVGADADKAMVDRTIQDLGRTH
jgi:F-type H+-transporting ATPase subunit b